ncbi:MAG: formylglycine-generating enzyme family protein [Sphingomonas sp.]
MRMVRTWTLAGVLLAAISVCTATKAPDTPRPGSGKASRQSHPIDETVRARRARWEPWRAANPRNAFRIAAFLREAERVVASRATAAAAAAVDQPSEIWGAGTGPISIWDNSAAPEMVVVPAGVFTMGSAAAEMDRTANERPMRRVVIRRPFAVGRFEITRGEYAQFSIRTRRTDENNCVTDRPLPGSGPPNTVNAANFSLDPQGSWRDPAFPQTDRHPAVCVSWNDAHAYVAWLSRTTGKHYRFLTEAEWEYVARAGTASAYWWGGKASHDDANYGAETCCSGLALGRDTWVKTAPVGSFQPNAFGLYDTAGNVWEWVQDCYGSYTEAPANGSPAEQPPNCERVIRGGAWVNYPLYIRAAVRGWIKPDFRDSYLGLRIARDL